MAELRFQDFRFEEKDTQIRFHFLRLYYFDVLKEDFRKLGSLRVREDALEFPEAKQEAAERVFFKVISRGFERLTNKLTGNPTLYIHRNSGIPLMGTLSFGIVDKGSDMLEVKPLTSCNADCVFCSVDEGPSSRKRQDFVVEKDYLVEEVGKLSAFKKHPMHVYINPQGEPTLYADLVELVRGLKALEFVREVHLITNLMLVSEKLADELIAAGLDSFNVSFHSLDPERAKELFHTRGYQVEKVRKTLLHVRGRIKVIVAPVLMMGVNEQDMDAIVAFCRKEGFEVMIQNFLFNKRGRNPVKEASFDRFEVFLRELEKKHGVPLFNLGKVASTPELPKPFVEGDSVEAEVFCEGRYKGEWYAHAKGRVMLVRGDIRKKGRCRVRIVKDAHNLFTAMKA